MFDASIGRRHAFSLFGGAAALAASSSALSAAPSQGKAPEETGDGMLSDLTRKLAIAPRRRAFSTVPFMLDAPDHWDHEAAELLLTYRGRHAQVWESTDIGAPWLNLMREAMNGQVFAHGHRDFLAVSATHGTAHLALFKQAMWDKYDLAANTGGKFTDNGFLREKPGVSARDDRQNVDGFYGPGNNNIVSLQRRGAVMVACHDSIHAIARGIAAKRTGSADTIAADLTNNLVDGAVLVPSVVAFLVDIQRAGFTYAKGS